jgi:hypothetical protein
MQILKSEILRGRQDFIHRREGNIKTDRREPECDVVWNRLVQDMVQWGGGSCKVPVF